MNAETATVAKYKLVGRNESDVPVRVAFSAYLGFGRQLDRQLRRLVTRWSHAASPWSRGMPAGPCCRAAAVGRGSRQ